MPCGTVRASSEAERTPRFRRIDGLPSHRASPGLFTPRTRILVPPSEPSHPTSYPLPTCVRTDRTPAASRGQPHSRPQRATAIDNLHAPFASIEDAHVARWTPGTRRGSPGVQHHQVASVIGHGLPRCPVRPSGSHGTHGRPMELDRVVPLDGYRVKTLPPRLDVRSPHDQRRFESDQASGSAFRPWPGPSVSETPVLVAVRPWPWPRLQAREVTACGICLDPCSSA